MLKTTLQSAFKNSSLKFRQQRSPLHFFSQGNVGLLVLRKKDKEHVHHTDPGHDTTVWQKPEMIGSGPVEATVPSQMEQSVGKERLQYLALREGHDPFHGLMDQLEDRRGTKQNPIPVLCPDDERVIGCNGPPEERHHTVWMIVTEDGHKYWQYGHNRCVECGNAYKLQRVELPYQNVL